jgi:NADH-quinone oxidoreductase subunit L
MTTEANLLLALWLLPLASAGLIWAFGPLLRRAAGVVGSLAVLAPFGIALMLWPAAFAQGGLRVHLFDWVHGFTFGLWLDPLSLLWTCIICGVGGLIHVYSIGYMWSDRAIARFFAYMNFFVFAMLTLVLSDNFVGLLAGWGLVGAASYFLIGFWFFKPTAVAAALKAFVINVVGDVGLMFAIFVLFAGTGSMAYADVFAKAPSLGSTTILLACVAIFIACAAKSAQIPLHTWLPDAMEGPTPVSALIHAATMVTAGVYLIARCAPLWDASPEARALVGTIGALTALFGAILGLAQWDIKRILAYSTMSQIGYMILGVGVGAYQAGILHFFTHAFFKAQLFLGAGIIIHALHDEQDVRKMGGLGRRMPLAFWAMTLGTAAIIGVPGFSGFFSKDAVIYGALEQGYPLLYLIGVVTAGITAFYMCRMLFVTFAGNYRGDVPDADLGIAPRPQQAEPHAGGHPPAWLMGLPVVLLIPGTVGAGWLVAGGAWNRAFLADFAERPVASVSHAIPEYLSVFLVLAFVALGALWAYRNYGSFEATASAVARLRAESLRMPAILTRAFYFDDLLEFLFVRPARAIGSAFMRVVDPRIIDGAVVDLAWFAGWLGRETRALQTGLVRGYALVVALGAAAFLAYFALLGFAR